MAANSDNSVSLAARTYPPGVVARLGNSRFVVPWGKAGAIALSPDGKRVASGGSKITIWNADTAEIIRQIDCPTHSGLEWSQTGRQLAAIQSTGELVVMGADGGTRWSRPRSERLVKESMAWPVIIAARFIDDDRVLAVVTAQGGPTRNHGDFLGNERLAGTPGWRVEFWNVEKGTLSAVSITDDAKRALLKQLGNDYEFRYVALSPSGDRVAWLASPPRDSSREENFDTASARERKSAVFVYETATGKLLNTVKDLPTAYRVDLADEGQTLVVHPVRPAEVDRVLTKPGMVVNIADGRVRFRYEHRFLPAHFYYGLSGRLARVAKSALRYRDWLLTFDNLGVVRWDWKTGKKMDECRMTPYPDMSGFAISADGRRIAIGEGSRLRVSDGDLAELEPRGEFFHWPSVRFLRDGRVMGRAGSYGSHDYGAAGRWIHLWNPGTKTAVESLWLHPWPKSAEYAATDAWGKLLSYQDRSSQPIYEVRDLVSNEPVMNFPCDRGSGLLPSGDGKRLLHFVRDTERLVVRWLESRHGKPLGQYETVFPTRFPGTEWYQPRWFADDGSVFGYQTQDHRLVLVECATSKVRFSVGIPPETAHRDPVWQYQSAGFDQLLFAKPSVERRVAEYAVWDRRGQLLRRSPLQVSKRYDCRYLCLSPDGRMITIMDGSQRVIGLYETATARRRGEIRLPYKIEGSMFETSVSFSPDGRLLATSGPDTTILLWDLARPLSGKEALPPPENIEQAERLWDLLGDPDPSESDRALWTLVEAPKHALRLMKESLQPLPKPDPKRLPILIAQLDSKDFKERETASRELLRMDETALPLLLAARKSASLEQGRRLDEAIARLESQKERTHLHTIRALEVLERIGTPEARRLVETVAASSGEDVHRHEARLILDRWQ